MLTLVVASCLLVVWIAGHYYARSLELAVIGRLPRDASGVIVGAGGFGRPGTSGSAVLMIHGCGDTPQTLTHVADELNRRGYAVLAPLLPGHGRSLADFSNQSADAWYDDTRARYLDLKREHDWVGVMGLSMGGALATRLAADFPELRAVVLVSPYLRMRPINDLLTQTSIVWGLFVPYVSTATDLSVLDPQARAKSLSYGAMTVSALRALRTTARRGWSALQSVRVPALVIQSKRDNRVAASDTARAFELLGSPEKSIEWIDGAGHVITVDYGWQHVGGLVGDWMDAHGGR